MLELEMEMIPYHYEISKTLALKMQTEEVACPLFKISITINLAFDQIITDHENKNSHQASPSLNF